MSIPRGVHLLRDPILNKGLAFTMEEREKYGLLGLLPPVVCPVEVQMQRVLENLRKKKDPLEKYIFLMGLLDRNETLFYYVVTHNVHEMMPLIYTPTVGLACETYGHIFRRPRGLFVPYTLRGRVSQVLDNWCVDDVQVIVVTDGERILGLGDLGANGMGIPVGKLSLYIACAGINPASVLPITLDVGTNNETLLKDPLYVGLRQNRVRGQDYDAFVEEFVQAVFKKWPKVLLQFEDFGNVNAFRLLEHYKDKVCCFNDDIQGTAAVTLAGLIASAHLLGTSLKDHKFLFFGAGEAGVGIADLISVGIQEDSNCSEEQARRFCNFVDSKGLVVKSRTDLQEHKQRYAHDLPAKTSLLEAVHLIKPTAIIGVSAQPQTFTKEVIEAMSTYNERPIIFALSNPTHKSECTAEQAYQYSKGKCLFASGSPFDTVSYGGHRFEPGQGNNSYIFPGVGLGVVAVRAKNIPDKLFLAAARSLAEQVQPSDLAVGRVYPHISNIRQVSIRIAKEVAREAIHLGLSQIEGLKQGDEEALVQKMVFEPCYRSLL